MLFVIVVSRFHAIKYSSLLSIVKQGLDSQGVKVMKLCVQKKDEGRGRCVSRNGARGGEYER